MSKRQRRRIRVEGIVQGVGFRPFVYRIAREMRLSGSVYNDSQGVLIEVEGQENSLDSFLVSLRKELPPLASISRLQIADVAVTDEPGFSIIESQSGCSRSAQISPDTYVCPDCLKELFDPENRRYRHHWYNY